MHYHKYLKYKNKYLNQKGANDMMHDILAIPYLTLNKSIYQKEVEFQQIRNVLDNTGRITIYEFKFNNINDDLRLDDYLLENTADDIINFCKDNALDRPIVVCWEHASPYGLYVVNKYPDMFRAIVCYPLRLYEKASLDRRIWKFRDQGGWDKYISTTYNIENYYLNVSDKTLRDLTKNPGKEELQILQLISDKLLQEQAAIIPKKFKIPTILFTRLDMDIDSIIALNYERKSIASMKGIVNENDALYTSMMWNFSRVKYDKNLLDKNVNNNNLRIKYYVAGMDDDRNIKDSIILISCNQLYND